MGQDNFKQLYTWAEKVKDEFSVEYNLEGVQKIEAAIVNDRQSFASWTENEQYYRVSSFGAFLGYCMILNFNGEWYKNGFSAGIRIPEQNVWVDPFHKVWKQSRQGDLLDSITSFYKISGNFQAIIQAEE